MNNAHVNLKSKIREIPNWPKKGVNFKDITPLLGDPTCFKNTVDKFTKLFKDKKIDKVVGIDARGFLLASAVAYKLKTGIAIVRKKGKLPHECVVQEYDLEYGKNCVEMHKDAILPYEKTIIIDDVLATGGTAKAAINLVEALKGEIAGLAFLLELNFLKGRNNLKNYRVYSLVKYNS